MKSMKMLDLIYSDILTSEEFLALTPSERRNISQVSIIPAKLGEPDFCKFQVIYKLPVYK